MERCIPGYGLQLKHTYIYVYIHMSPVANTGQYVFLPASQDYTKDVLRGYLTTFLFLAPPVLLLYVISSGI